MKDKAEQKHDRIVNTTYQRLMKHYVTLEKFLSYSNNGISGEIDIFAERGPWNHFYEIKSHYSHKSLARAKEQFARFRSAYPGLLIKGIYVTPERVLRLRGDK